MKLSEDVLRVLVTEADHLNQKEMDAVEPQPIQPREERTAVGPPGVDRAPARATTAARATTVRATTAAAAATARATTARAPPPRRGPPPPRPARPRSEVDCGRGLPMRERCS